MFQCTNACKQDFVTSAAPWNLNICDTNVVCLMWNCFIVADFVSMHVIQTIIFFVGGASGRLFFVGGVHNGRL